MSLILLHTKIKADIRIVFDLSCSIDLHKISTDHTKEEAIAGVTTGLIKDGETVTWRANHFGLSLKLTSIITAYERPYHFRDEQLRGPFSYFRHDHSFREDNGLVLMEDRFDFSSPLGILGKLADRLVLKRHLEKLLTLRNSTIKDYAESGKWKDVLPKSGE